MTVNSSLVKGLQRRSGDLLAVEQKSRRMQGLPPLRGDDERQAGRGFIQAAIGEHQASLVEQGKPP